MPEPLWLEWLLLGGLLAFAVWLLGTRGVWALLLHADPTGLTLVIVVLFSGATLWCGARARTLQREHVALRRTTSACGPARAWWADYRTVATHDADAAIELLVERTHGPHAAAWWVNGIQLKLGLLGKVIGFSMLALEIGRTTSFDPSQSQALLRSLTAGLGVALLTTMVGLVANILLGLQLTRLDRYADRLLADIQRAAIPEGDA